MADPRGHTVPPGEAMWPLQLQDWAFRLQHPCLPPGAPTASPTEIRLLRRHSPLRERCSPLRISSEAELFPPFRVSEEVACSFQAQQLSVLVQSLGLPLCLLDLSFRCVDSFLLLKTPWYHFRQSTCHSASPHSLFYSVCSHTKCTGKLRHAYGS